MLGRAILRALHRVTALSDPSAHFAHIPSPFTPAELDAIERYGDGLAPVPATLGDGSKGGGYNDVRRRTQVAPLRHGTETAWIYERLVKAALHMNSVYEFELGGFAEPFQYMVYRAEEASHFDWHTDQNQFAAPRKLSLTMQLSDPAAYQGCDLQFFNGDVAISAPRARGTLVVFPSYTMHRVSPITSGTRKALVAWVAGPKFR